MLVPLVIGFNLAALVMFAAVHALGSSVAQQSRLWTTSVVVALGLAALIDLALPGIRISVFRRQTPKSLPSILPPPLAGFLWGLDTGTVVSTFRTSMASWAALVVTFAGIVPWWAGLTYGAAFSLPLMGAIWTTRPQASVSPSRLRARFAQLDTGVLLFGLGRASRTVRVVSAMVAVLAATTLGTQAV